MSERHRLRKLRMIQRSVEDSIRKVMAEPDKFGVSPFGETAISMDRQALEGIVMFCMGRRDQEEEKP